MPQINVTKFAIRTIHASSNNKNNANDKAFLGCPHIQGVARETEICRDGETWREWKNSMEATLDLEFTARGLVEGFR